MPSTATLRRGLRITAQSKFTRTAEKELPCQSL